MIDGLNPNTGSSLQPLTRNVIVRRFPA